MFIQIDKTTKEEQAISGENMVSVLENDMEDSLIDEVLTDMVTGVYEHHTRTHIYLYRPDHAKTL